MLHALVAAILAVSAPWGVARNAGITVRYPPGWIASTRGSTHVVNPVLRFELFSGTTDVQIQELVPPLLTPRGLEDFPARPGPFRAAEEPPGGSGTWFRRAGRAFYVFTTIGPRASTARRAVLAAILRGIRVEPRAVVHWRRSESLGLPWHGRLVRGVQLPAQGRHYFTWDPILHRSPDRPWRRYGSDELVRLLLRVASQYAAAHPGAVRIGIGDVSRTHGGDFGPRYGLPGHISHQNGLDADVYYPRRDGRELAPRSPAQIDHALAQDLVRRFVRAGAATIFVGPHTGLTGPRGVVWVLAHHDDHLHVRIALGVRRTVLLGRSVRGRPIRAVELGDPTSARKTLVVGCIHGTECAGIAIAEALARGRPPAGLDLWVVPNLNPDGFAEGRRQNARGVDLNRNFPAMWERIGRPGSTQYSGPRPLSEPESRIARALIVRLRPRVTVWFHQPQAVVRAWGPSIPAARRYARLAGVPFRAMAWPAGTVSNWQNHRFPGQASFVVELPAGSLSATAAARYARAILLAARIG